MCCWADSPFVMRAPSVYTTLFCGALAGIVGRTATAPISRMGIIAQVQTESENFWTVVKRIKQREGLIKGFWRGNLPTILKIGPSVAVSLTLFDTLNLYLQRNRSFGPWASDGLNHFASGAVAGMVSLTITYPLDIVRTNMSVEGKNVSMRETFRQIGGGRSLFRGLGLALAEVVPSSGLRFWLLSKARDLMSQRLTDANPYALIIAASIGAGCISQIVTYPLVVIRRNQQMSNRSAWDCTKYVFRKRRLYSGLGINLLQVVPSVGISFGVYEYAKQLLK